MGTSFDNQKLEVQRLDERKGEILDHTNNFLLFASFYFCIFLKKEGFLIHQFPYIASWTYFVWNTRGRSTEENQTSPGPSPPRSIWPQSPSFPQKLATALKNKALHSAIHVYHRCLTYKSMWWVPKWRTRNGEPDLSGTTAKKYLLFVFLPLIVKWQKKKKCG